MLYFLQKDARAPRKYNLNKGERPKNLDIIFHSLLF